MYYLNINENGYLMFVSTTPMVDAPEIESIEEYDFSGVRVNAYRWNGNELIFDNDRFLELKKRDEERKTEMRDAVEREAALIEAQAALVTAQINTIVVDDKTALRWRLLYPEWEPAKDYKIDEKVQYDKRLFKCLQSHTSQLGWEPTNVPALWTEISETHDGTYDDPIPYNNNMELENGKYYTQYDVKYYCTRDTGIPVYNPLSELVGLYVEVVE